MQLSMQTKLCTHRHCVGHFDAAIVDDVTTTFRVETSPDDEEELAENHEDWREDEDEGDSTEGENPIEKRETHSGGN